MLVLVHSYNMLCILIECVDVVPQRVYELKLEIEIFIIISFSLSPLAVPLFLSLRASYIFYCRFGIESISFAFQPMNYEFHSELMSKCKKVTPHRLLLHSGSSEMELLQFMDTQFWMKRQTFWLHCSQMTTMASGECMCQLLIDRLL